jgi:hypothetical protein
MRLFKMTSAPIALLASMLLTSPGNAQEPASLLTTLAAWKYPGSEMSGATLSDAATVNSAGQRTRPSVQYMAVLTTKDPVPKVLEHYRAQLQPAADSKTALQKADSTPDAGRSVTFHADSKGRPLAIEIINVNTATNSTTLVISRAEGESLTHIAWSLYQRF